MMTQKRALIIFGLALMIFGFMVCPNSEAAKWECRGEVYDTENICEYLGVPPEGQPFHEIGERDNAWVDLGDPDDPGNAFACNCCGKPDCIPDKDDGDGNCDPKECKDKDANGVEDGKCECPGKTSVALTADCQGYPVRVACLGNVPAGCGCDCCGNGIHEPLAGEDCDDGNDNDNDDCRNDCTFQQFKPQCNYELKGCCDFADNDSVTGKITVNWVPDVGGVPADVTKQGFIKWEAKLEGDTKQGQIAVPGANLGGLAAAPGNQQVDVTFDNCNASCDEKCVDEPCVELLDEKFKCEFEYFEAGGGKVTKDILQNANMQVTCVYENVLGQVFDAQTADEEPDCTTECLLECPDGDQGTGAFEKVDCVMAGVTQCKNSHDDYIDINCIDGTPVEPVPTPCTREFVCLHCNDPERGDCPETLGTYDC